MILFTPTGSSFTNESISLINEDKNDMIKDMWKVVKGVNLKKFLPQEMKKKKIKSTGLKKCIAFRYLIFNYFFIIKVLYYQNTVQYDYKT